MPNLNQKYQSFRDDKQWLKEGPSHRTNKYGAFRFARGYFAYAGSGKNSRGNQLIVALGDNQRLGGKGFVSHNVLTVFFYLRISFDCFC